MAARPGVATAFVSEAIRRRRAFGPRPEDQPCLLWPFTRGAKGYGRVKLGGQMVRVGRVVLTESVGPPPTPEHTQGHLCGVTACVVHLEWQTREEQEAERAERRARERESATGVDRRTART